MTTPLHETLDSATLLRFIDGTATAEERERVERWMAASEPNRREFARLTRAWEMTGRMPEAMPDASAMWSRIAPMLSETSQRGAATDAEVASSARRPLVLMPVPARSRWLSGPLPLLAAAGVLLAVGLVFRDAVIPGDDDVVAPGRTYTTRPGERAELRLADGSRVVLGGGTTLRIPESVPASPRDVYLDGEAYFDVSSDSMTALRVHTPLSVAEDLGTRFLIVAYSSDTAELVAVAEGVVQVQGSDTTESVVLRANDVGHVSAGGSVRATRGVDVERYLSWMNGVLEFENQLLSDAVRVIERQYGVQIRITDSALARRRFTGSIRAASLHEDLRGLALLLDARYERKGKQVTLRPLAEQVSPPSR